MLTSILTSPHLIDVILCLIMLEAGAVVFAGGLSARATFRMLLPGVFILVALRAALADAAWPFVPAALVAALIAHLVELKARWHR